MYLAAANVPEFKFRLSFERRWIGKVLGFSTWVIGYQILGNALLLFERGWIMRKLGPEALTYYVVPMTIGLYIHSSVGSLMLVLFPLTSEFIDNREKLSALYQKATKLTAIFVGFVLCTLVTLSSEFLTVWMGAEFANETALLLVFHTITFSLAAIFVVAWQMADGLGYPSYNFGIFSVCLIVSLVGMIYLIDEYSNLGMAASRLAGFGISTPEHVSMVCEHADGAVVGSWLVNELAGNWNGGAGREQLIEKVKALKAATKAS